MKKIYFVRCMKTFGSTTYSVIDNRSIIFRCGRYSQLISFLKEQLSYFNKLGMTLEIRSPKSLPCLNEDVYSYEY